jgi:hypothetical protein
MTAANAARSMDSGGSGGGAMPAFSNLFGRKERSVPTGPDQQSSPMGYMRSPAGKIADEDRSRVSDELLAQYLRMNQMRY